MFLVSRTPVVQTKQCVGTGLLHGCLRFLSWPCRDTVTAGLGHSNVTLPHCKRETKQDVKEALALQTNLGAKAMSPVTLFTVYIDKYRDSFLGSSMSGGAGGC